MVLLYNNIDIRFVEYNMIVNTTMVLLYNNIYILVRFVQYIYILPVSHSY